MIFDAKVITQSRKAHQCMMCLSAIPKGSIYISVPHKNEADGTFEAIKLCPECGYIMKHADRNTFKLGNFTDTNIPNKLRKIRNEYRKDPVKAWESIKGENDEN